MMRCPSCKRGLWPVGQQPDPCDCEKMVQAYGCPNKQCITHEKLYWDDTGIIGAINWDFEDETLIDCFIDHNNAPFGSWARKINTEVYKKDENKEFYWRRLGVDLKYNYLANEDGEVIKRSRELRIWYKPWFYLQLLQKRPKEES